MIRRTSIALVTLLLCVRAPVRLCAQADWSTSRGAAVQVARAWRAHDFSYLVGRARVELRMPGVSAAGPIPAEQAVVLLQEYVRGDTEVSVEVASVSEVGDLSGYVEIRRRYRPRGAQEPVEEVVLIGLVRSRAVRSAVEPAAQTYGLWRVEVVQAGGGRGR